VLVPTGNGSFDVGVHVTVAGGFDVVGTGGANATWTGPPDSV
jgi:hypothetical protein